MSTYTIDATTTLTTMVCGKCGITFAMPDELREACLRDHSKSWYCPNGHSRVFVGQTTAEKAQERANALARQLASREDDLRCERLSHRATKGQLTKVRKRAAHGVCPVPSCQRSFANVERHVASQHPDFQAAVT